MNVSGIQEKLGIVNAGIVYAVFDYDSEKADELSFKNTAPLTILRKGDDTERDWWWARAQDREGYVPRNLLGVKNKLLVNWFKYSVYHSIYKNPFSIK